MEIVITIGVIVCLLIGIWAENIGESRGKRKREEQAMVVLRLLEDLINEKDYTKALLVLRRYTSREASISEINPYVGTIQILDYLNINEDIDE